MKKVHSDFTLTPRKAQHTSTDSGMKNRQINKEKPAKPFQMKPFTLGCDVCFEVLMASFTYSV